MYLISLNHFQGNAMGYIRMVRSGGLNCCSSAIRFVPNVQDIGSFTNLCVDHGLSPETIAAAKYPNACIDYYISHGQGP